MALVAASFTLWNDQDSKQSDESQLEGVEQIIKSQAEVSNEGKEEKGLWNFIKKRYSYIAKRAADLKKSESAELGEVLKNCSLIPTSTAGYRRAEAMAGGVDTAELSSKTMECKSTKNLFFIGEVVDVTGLVGGFNFQWAWSSAFVAAKCIKDRD